MFLPEAMKIENFEKLVANLYDKTKYFIHISNLKLVLNHGLVFKMRHRIIKFNQKTWMNTNLRKKTKIDFGKDSFKLMNNSVFGKTMENVRKHGNINKQG